MPLDHEVMREMWSCTVPVQFSLAANQVRSVDKPLSIYVGFGLRSLVDNAVNFIVVSCRAALSQTRNLMILI